ncbi:uncharacterized protein LOC142620099 [Castanea sativa]|uniref:uncharacterized protein LOC142620099 n=1 Tax=Castanea sativa TaxID=21020 RepID=UPI003F64D155
MSEHHLASYAASSSGGSFWGSSWRERSHKRNEDRRHDQEGGHSSSGEGSSQTYRSTLNASGHECHDKRDRELERMHRRIRDLELELQERCRRRVFRSSLERTALRWFNELRKGSIHSFGELIQEFGAQFMTCSRVPQPVDALLSLKMGAGETLRSYASRYWELYNEIGGDNEKVAANTFRLGLPEDFELRESLTMRPLEDIRQLMRRIKEYKILEDDRQQNKGIAPTISQSKQGGFQSRSRRDLKIQEPETQLGEINMTFKEPVHKIVDQIKNEPYFRWPNKMGGDPSRRDQNLYCNYHREKRHTTE